uniref:Uncharacterized protein n=1 Tax=Parascaris equorum TaxID=6256 RepID=A0A914RMR0_PAREQ
MAICTFQALQQRVRAASAGDNAGGGGAEGSGKDAAKEAALVEQVEDILASSGSHIELLNTCSCALRVKECRS